MQLKRNFLILALTLILAAAASAQTPSVLTGGLLTPNKVITAPGGELLVAEAGTLAPNTGRISIVDRVTGNRRTLIDGLPSAVSNLGGGSDPDGPSGLSLGGNKLYVTIGVGDSVVPGPGSGLESPNPTPSSPLFNSVLEIGLYGRLSTLTGFSLSAADQAAIAGGQTVTLSASGGRRITVSLVANLPDYIAAPFPGNPDNAKASHLYGIEQQGNSLFLADSGLNRITEVDRRSGTARTLASFPPVPNPLPFGPPFIEAVPDNVHRCGNSLLVPLLTGFPFVPGLASIQSVRIKNGNTVPLITGLTSAIDVLPLNGDDSSGGCGTVYTLEFSTNQLAGAPGRLRYYSSPSATPVDLLTSLITPTSMARDDETGDLFITNIGPGLITKVTFP